MGNNKQVIYRECGVLHVTTEQNYNARIRNARIIHRMADFRTPAEIVEYYCKWFKSNPEDFIVKE